MTSRGIVSWLLIVFGLLLMVLSYFYWSAPWGLPPTGPEFSNPRIPYAPLIFIIGVILVFLAAVVYEVYPEREIKGPE